MKLLKSKYFLLISLTILLLLQNSFCFARELEVPDIPGITGQSKLPEYLKAIFVYMMGLGGALALLFFIIGAVSYLASAGKPEAMSNAISRMKGAILGLMLLFSSWLIMETINPEIKKIEIETKRVPATLELTKDFVEFISAPLVVADTTNIKDYKIAWRREVCDKDGNNCKNNCETDANSNIIENATYLMYPYSDKDFKNIMLAPIRLGCGFHVPLTTVNSYYIQKEVPGIYFYPEAGCEFTDVSLVMEPFGPSSIDSWKRGTQKSVRLVNGDDPNKGPFYGVIVFEDENQTGDEWEHIPACGDFNCLNKTRDSQCHELNIQNVTDGTSVTVYQWVGYDDSGNIASAGEGVDLRTKPNWTGGRYLIPDSEIKKLGILQIEPKKYKPDYTGSGVPKEEQDLCNNFGYQALWHCLNSIQILGNYLLVLSEGNVASGWRGGNNSDAQRFPISTNLLAQILGKYTEYQTESGPIDLTLDWYYNDGNIADWLTIIPLADKLP